MASATVRHIIASSSNMYSRRKGYIASGCPRGIYFHVDETKLGSSTWISPLPSREELEKEDISCALVLMNSETKQDESGVPTKMNSK